MATQTGSVLIEALDLSREVVELLESGGSLQGGLLKAARLASLVENPLLETICRYELQGYPVRDSEPVRTAAAAAGRVDPDGLLCRDSIAVLEDMLATARKRLETLTQPSKVFHEREVQATCARQLATSRSSVAGLVVDIYHGLQFAGASEGVFTRMSERVVNRLAGRFARAGESIDAITANLNSSNPEDWANAVHGCRRLLKALADELYPPRDPISRVIKGKEKSIGLGPEEYKNRLVTFVESRSSSERFQAIVGSQLEFLINRLDAVYEASSKGTHDRVEKEEADRYVIYTYLLVGDILSLEQ